MGQTLPQKIWHLFSEPFHDFLNECSRAMHLRCLSEADINKFLQNKPELTKEDLLAKLPDWLRDLSEAFLPQLANQLPICRPWDHKIEIMPGKEPPYQKNHPFSPPKLKVVRKWINDNLAKGFIRESRARCAAPLLLAAKPGGGIWICQDYWGLNNITIKNRYLLPLIWETLDALCNAKVYTKLDIIATFNKLHIAEGHEWKPPSSRALACSSRSLCPLAFAMLRPPFRTTSTTPCMTCLTRHVQHIWMMFWSIQPIEGTTRSTYMKWCNSCSRQACKLTSTNASLKPLRPSTLALSSRQAESAWTLLRLKLFEAGCIHQTWRTCRSS